MNERDTDRLLDTLSILMKAVAAQRNKISAGFLRTDGGIYNDSTFCIRIRRIQNILQIYVDKHQLRTVVSAFFFCDPGIYVLVKLLCGVPADTANNPSDFQTQDPFLCHFLLLLLLCLF